MNHRFMFVNGHTQSKSWPVSPCPLLLQSKRRTLSTLHFAINSVFTEPAIVHNAKLNLHIRNHHDNALFPCLRKSKNVWGSQRSLSDCPLWGKRDTHTPPTPVACPTSIFLIRHCLEGPAKWVLSCKIYRRLIKLHTQQVCFASAMPTR